MAIAAAATAARGALRRLVRAKNRAFKGDSVMLQAASQTIREEFNRQMGATSEEDVEKSMGEMEKAIVFLESNVIQAPLNTRGNYEVDIKSIDERPIN